jgi:hypothetical protein
MLRWLWCKIIGVGCQWETLEVRDLVVYRGNESPDRGQRYYQRCTTCGKVIKRDLA